MKNNNENYNEVYCFILTTPLLESTLNLLGSKGCPLNGDPSASQAFRNISFVFCNEERYGSVKQYIHFMFSTLNIWLSKFRG